MITYPESAEEITDEFVAKLIRKMEDEDTRIIAAVRERKTIKQRFLETRFHQDHITAFMTVERLQRLNIIKPVPDCGSPIYEVIPQTLSQSTLPF